MKRTKGCQIQISLGIPTIIYANTTTVQKYYSICWIQRWKKKKTSIHCFRAQTISSSSPFPWIHRFRQFFLTTFLIFFFVFVFVFVFYQRDKFYKDKVEKNQVRRLLWEKVSSSLRLKETIRCSFLRMLHIPFKIVILLI